MIQEIRIKLEDSNDSESVKKKNFWESFRKMIRLARKTLILIRFRQDFGHARGIYTRAAAKQLLEQSHFLMPQYLGQRTVPVGHIRQFALWERRSCCLERKMFGKIESLQSLPQPMLY